MKKFLFIIAVFCTLFTSCSKDNTVVPQAEQAIASFTIKTPEISTRYGEGEEAKTLHWAVYDSIEGYIEGISSDSAGTASLSNLSATIELSLVEGRSYTILFWAQNDSAPYKKTWGKTPEEAQICYTDITKLKANSETYDAFFGKVVLNNIKGAINQTVDLNRPFAQLNIATADITKAISAGFNVVRTGVKVSNVYTTFGLLEGDVRGEAVEELVFDTTNMAGGQIEVNTKKYDMLSMNYLLVQDKRLVDITLMLQENNTVTNVLTRTYTSVPVQRNYRTNIVGNILTNEAEFTVDVRPGFTEGDLMKWDGEMISKPTYDAATDTYYISHAAELAWIAALVNGTLPSDMRSTEPADNLAGTTIILEHDIDLGGKEWTPIGTDDHHFMGTIDGQGNAIRNFKVTARHNSTRAALFGTISGTITFRNLTIENASIECPDFEADYYGSALIGSMYGYVRIENVKVINSYISGNNKVGALIAHDALCNSLTIDNCLVEGVTFEALNTADSGSVGGLIGYFQGAAKNTNAAPYGEHYIKNSEVKDCTFNVVNSTNTGKRANSQLIGGINSVAGQELYIDNCSVSNNTWNETFYVDGTEVTENTFKSPYGVLIGGERNDDPKGKVFIDGYEIVGPGVGLKNGDYYILEASGLYWVAEQVNTMEYYVNAAANILDGKNVYLTKDIDLGGAEWTPIGDYAFSRTIFRGIFDGKGHTISNFQITKQTSWTEKVAEASYGFFGNMAGTIKNLTIDNATVYPENNRAYVGVLVGRLKQDGLIENCHVKNSVATTTYWQVGGIVGQVENAGNIKNCSIGNSTITGRAAAGAIAGLIMKGGEYTIENCEVKNCDLVQGKPYSDDDFNSMFGLAVGAVNNSDITLNLNDITVDGNTIKGEASDVLVGYIESGANVNIDGAGYYPTGYYTDDTGVYHIVNGKGFAALSAVFANGGKFVLDNNINMSGIEYTAFHQQTLGQALFEFDGNGKKITNLSITSGEYAALFGKLWNFYIHDVTIESSTFIATTYSSALVAYTDNTADGSYTKKIENCNVVDCTVGSSKYVGSVIAYSGSNTLVINKCSVSDSNIASKYSEDSNVTYKGHCGGIIGGCYGGTISECSATNNTYDVLGDRTGIIVGSAWGGTFTSITQSGNTGLDRLCGLTVANGTWN